MLNVAYSEIMMKGGNRRSFIHRLENNVLAALAPAEYNVKRLQGRIILTPKDKDPEDAVERAARVFGVESVAMPIETKLDLEEIKKAALAKAPQLRGKKIKVHTRRSNKAFPMTSQDVSAEVGAELVDAGCAVDLSNPEAVVFVELLRDRALIFTEKVKGPGGLPTGSSGKLLSLISGGIDSPVSSWMMMKRGCTIDFLHLHQSPSNKDVLDTKMRHTLLALGRYMPNPPRLLLAPYTEFYKKSMSVKPRIELVIFRRFLFKLTNELAKKGYQGVITGDSVGQVASQTLENLFASDEASAIPVYRPLAGYNKQEIIDLSKRIGTYDVSIKPYKDCCSLVAHKSPSIKVSLEMAKQAEEEMGMDSIVEKTIEQTELFEITS